MPSSYDEPMKKGGATTKTSRHNQALGTAQARAAVARAITQVWTRRIPKVELPKCPMTLEPIKQQAAVLADQTAAGCFEQGVPEVAQAMGSLYSSLMDQGVRSVTGVFYTPPRLAQKLADTAERAGANWRTARILDPAIGFAALMMPVIHKVRQALGDELSAEDILQHIETHLYGWELDDFSAWAAEVLLSLAIADDCNKAGRALSGIVIVGNSLHKYQASEHYDVIITNPPYGKITLDREMRNAYAGSVYGHANLYGVFADLCMRTCTPQGVISLLIPTSFLAGLYFKNLRRMIRTKGQIEHLEVLEPRSGLFEDVLQEALICCVTIGEGGDYAKVATSSEAEGTIGNLLPLPLDPEAPWIVPRTSAQIQLTRNLGLMPWRLADHGLSVSTGPLVWNRMKDSLHGESTRTATSLPVLWGESVQGGVFAHRHDRATHQPFITIDPATEAHLIQKEQCLLLQRTTGKEQNRRLICAHLPQAFLDEAGGAVVENHLNVIWSHGHDPSNPLDEDHLQAIACILNSEACDRVFRCLSGSVAVSAYELEALPLPSPEQVREIMAMQAAKASQQALQDRIASFYQSGAGATIRDAMIEPCSLPPKYSNASG